MLPFSIDPNVLTSSLKSKLLLTPLQVSERNNVSGDESITSSVLGEGWSPLHVAAWRGHPNFVKMLLDAGADAIGKGDKETPYDIAVKFRYSKDRRTAQRAFVVDDLQMKQRDGVCDVIGFGCWKEIEQNDGRSS